jgi:hypothetical protein
VSIGVATTAQPRTAGWPLPSRRVQLGLWLAGGLLGTAAFLLLGRIGVPQTGGFVICAFRRVTGIPCPGCGLTRAMAALARGELATAVRFHPFAPLLLAEALALWGAIGAAVLRRRPVTLPVGLPERLLIWQGAAFVALWIGRLATGTLPW